jgi:hypothetical protein
MTTTTTCREEGRLLANHNPCRAHTHEDEALTSCQEVVVMVTQERRTDEIEREKVQYDEKIKKVVDGTYDTSCQIIQK